MRGPFDGELIGRTFKLVLVDRASKLRLDENTERTFFLNHFFGDRLLLGGVDMTRGKHSFVTQITHTT